MLVRLASGDEEIRFARTIDPMRENKPHNDAVPALRGTDGGDRFTRIDSCGQRRRKNKRRRGYPLRASGLGFANPCLYPWLEL